MSRVYKYEPQPFCALMRKVARKFASRSGTVTTDDLRKWASPRNIRPTHPNTWGSVFKTGGFHPIGRINSQIPTNHKRSICVWALN